MVKNSKGDVIVSFAIENYSQQQLVNQLKEQKYSLEIKQYYDKRSLEQNRMLWHNLQIISEELGQDIMKTYCDLLERADAKSDFVITAFEMSEQLRKSFRGVRFIKMQEVNGKDCYIYKVYLGSSKMDKKEMSQLLEISFDLLAELGIEREYY